MGLFDKVTGDGYDSALSPVRAKNSQGQARESRQTPVQELRTKHSCERSELAKRILELRNTQQKQSQGTLSQKFK